VLLSFARGLSAVGASPLILVVTFVAVLVLWLVVTAYGAGLAASSGVMVQFMELPPARTYIDLGSLQIGRLNLLGAVGLGVGLIVFRAVLAGFLIAAIDQNLRGPLSWRRAFADAVRRTRGSFWVLIAVEVGYVAGTLFVAALSLLLGGQSGILFYFAWLVGGVYYFVYAEITAVLERAPIRWAVAWGLQAARLRGREHAMLVFSYQILSIVLSIIVSGRALLTATPPVVIWVAALFSAFVHVSVLAAFVWRWQVLADPVKAGAGVRSTPGGEARRPSLVGRALGLGGPRR
jgi:hypothetical protein